MTNAPPTRKTHVIRIVGTNRAGDVLQDIWADVERMDIVKSATQLTHVDWQGHQKKLRWMDDPDTDEYNPDGNPARKTDIVKVCDPESQADINDPDEWIPIHVIKSMRSRGGGGNIDGLGTMDRFRTGVDSDATPTTRIVEVRRIPHYDTNIDDRAQSAFDADPSRKAYVVSGDAYVKDAATKDDTQYVEHEIIQYIKHRTNETSLEIGDVNRGRQTKFRNQYLIDESDDAKLDKTGAGGINPPYRLDPYQNIVNVKFAQDVIIVFIDLGGALDAPSVLVPNPDKKDSIKFLKSFRVKPSETAGSGTLCTAYKVSANVGEFMTTVYPGVAEGTFKNQVTMRIAVFAMDGSDVDSSLQRAENGTKSIVLASTTTVTPPGVLWLIAALVATGRQHHWKVRLGKHRPDKSSQPPNSMVQCYQIDGPFSTSDGGITGYLISFYRLDRKGEGVAYGANPDPTSPDTQPIDPAWHQILAYADISHIPGIPFSDPPPLINVDLS